MPTYQELGFGRGAVAAREDSRAIFGQVMGLVAFTCGFAALGAYVARNMSGGTGIVFFIAAFACIFGLNYAASHAREQLAIALLFGMGLFLGMAVSPILVYYAKTDSGVVYQAIASTAGFVGILGAGGYATRRDLTVYYRTVFWALIALIVFGLIATFVAIPHANIIYCVAGLGVFGVFTVLDFNRLSRTRDARSAVPIAASIFLDIFNVFLFMINLLGGGGNRR